MQKGQNIFNKLVLFIIRAVLCLLPAAWLVAVVISFAEVYFYPGVIFKHTSLDSFFIYLAFVAMGLAGLYGSEWKSNRILRAFRKLNFFAICIFGPIYGFFYLLNSFEYANYVFSTFHINPLQLSIPLALSIYGYLIASKGILLEIYDKQKISLKWFPLVVVLVWIFVQNFIGVGVYAARDLSFIVKNPRASYDQKMEEKIGKQFYDYALFIKENTPENSKILLPPFPTSQWPQTGNIPYMTYFLYPRVLLNGEEYSPKYDLKKDNIDYVLVVWGETDSTVGNHTNGWPKFDVNATDVIYFTPDGELVKKPGNYVYEDVKGERLWGLIKVKK